MATAKFRDSPWNTGDYRTRPIARGPFRRPRKPGPFASLNLTPGSYPFVYSFVVSATPPPTPTPGPTPTPVPPPTGVPTMPMSGLLVTALVLLGFAVLVLRRRPVRAN